MHVLIELLIITITIIASCSPVNLFDLTRVYTLDEELLEIFVDYASRLVYFIGIKLAIDQGLVLYCMVITSQ